MDAIRVLSITFISVFCLAACNTTAVKPGYKKEHSSPSSEPTPAPQKPVGQGAEAPEATEPQKQEPKSASPLTNTTKKVELAQPQSANTSPRAKPEPAPAKIKSVPVTTTTAPKKSTPATKPASDPGAKTPADKNAATIKEEASAVSAPSNSIQVTLNSLPIAIAGQWVVDRSVTECTLESSQVYMEDGQGGTTVKIYLTASRLEIQTKSSIDLSYSGTGISIDGGSPFPLETLERDTNLLFANQRSALVEAMASGKNLLLTLGFWPTWPVTQTYSATIPLEHFATALNAWETCNSLLNGR